MTHLPQPARGRSLVSHRAVRRAKTETTPVERLAPRGKRVSPVVVAAAESSSAEVEMRAADANS